MNGKIFLFDTNEIFLSLNKPSKHCVKLKFINLRIIYKFRSQARIINFRFELRKIISYKNILRNISSQV